MLVWLVFILGPLCIGASTFSLMRVEKRPRANAAIEAGGTVLLLILLIGSLSLFSEWYGRVVFYEFLVGCLISILVQGVVHRHKAY